MGRFFSDFGMVIGSPNGEASIAGRQDFTSAFETHEDNITTAEHEPSRVAELWRRAAKARVAQVAFLAAVVGGGIVACGEAAPNVPAATNTTHLSTPETTPQNSTDKLFTSLTSLTPPQQEERRLQIAQLDVSTVQQLSPIEQSRWATYYQHTILSEEQIIPFGTYDVQLTPNQQNPNHSIIANELLQEYEANILRMAWMLQHTPQMAADSRTAMALLANSDTTTYDYKMAQEVADEYTITQQGDQSMPGYVQAISKIAVLFKAPSDVMVTKKGDVYNMNFTAAHSDGTIEDFSYDFYPSPVLPGGTLGNIYEVSADTPTKIQGKPLLVTLPKITPKAS